MDKTILLAYKPSYYKDSVVMQNIDNANANELILFNTAVTNSYNNCFIDTADSASLARVEEQLGLDVATNYDIAYRRTRIYSRLKGQGTFTVAFLQNIAESFENGEVDIIENNANYAFSVKFVGTKGIPPNLDDLKAVIEELKPAHLGVIYEFTWLTWTEHDNYNKTWSQWDSLNLTWSAFETYKQ